MVTTIAFHLLAYCIVVVSAAVVVRLSARRRPKLRSLAIRLIAIFGIFAIAAAYVWLELGPRLDHRIALQNQPLLFPPAPSSIEI